MVTTSRVIVVLRGELGNQLKLANLRLKKTKAIPTKVGDALKFERKIKDIEIAEKSIQRIESAVHALGRLNLGDIEDIDLF